MTDSDLITFRPRKLFLVYTIQSGSENHTLSHSVSKVKLSLNRPSRPRMLQYVETPRIFKQSAHEGSKAVSSTHRPPLPPRRETLVHFSVRGTLAGTIKSKKPLKNPHRDFSLFVLPLLLSFVLSFLSIMYLHILCPYVTYSLQRTTQSFMSRRDSNPQTQQAICRRPLP